LKAMDALDALAAICTAEEEVQTRMTEEKCRPDNEPAAAAVVKPSGDVSEQRARAIERLAVGMDGYVQVLAEHLLEEEREVLHVWLLMDREAYAHYRRELPFFYQVMY
jgi:hypothetical protein